MKKLFTLLFVTLGLTSQGQNWQNITPHKGAVPLAKIAQDNKNNWYLFCNTGMFVSSNQGNSWSKLGKKIFEAYKQVNSDQELGYNGIQEILVVKDTIYVTIRTSNSFSKCLYYEKGTNTWKLSPKTIGIDRTNSATPFTNGNDVLFFNYQTASSSYALFYSKDGMKTWTQHPKKFRSKNLFWLDNKWTLAQEDSIFQLDDNMNAIGKKTNASPGYNWTFNVAKQLLTRFYITAFEPVDSLIVETLHPTTLQWTKISSAFIPESFQYGYQQLVLTSNGTLIGPIRGNAMCSEGFRMSTDWGKTWSNMQMKPYISEYAAFQEIGDRLYFNRLGNLLQCNASKGSPNFNYANPNDFGSQGGQQLDGTTKHYIGNHLNFSLCPNDTSQLRQRWDGSKWSYLKRAQLPTIFYSGTLRQTTHYYIRLINNDFFYTKDEGLTYDSLLFPFPFTHLQKEHLQLTEVGNIFFGVFDNKSSDSLFVSKDFGKNWQIKKAPNPTLKGSKSVNASIDFSGDTLLFFYDNREDRKIFSSISNGDQWEDITYNLPTDLPFQGALVDHTTKATVLPLSKRKGWGYQMFQLNRKTKTWDMMDSTSHYIYANSLFRSDTAIRIKFTAEKYAFEIRYGQQPWISLDNAMNEITQNDTILQEAPYFSYNSKGLYINTNYGLFYRPHTSIVTSLPQALLDHSETSDYSLFPNPTEHTLQISTSESHVDYVLTDLTGQEMGEANAWDTKQSIEVKGLKTGAYLLRIKGNDRALLFIKQ